MPFLISILIHSLVGLAVLWGTAQKNMKEGLPGKPGTGNGESQLNGGHQNKEIIPIELKTIEPPKLVDTKEKDPNGIKDVKVNKVDCPNYFGGIGINYNRIDDTVLKVIRGYPAARSGCIQEGDIVHHVESDNGDIEGEIGKTIVLTLIRDGIRISCTIVRGKICIKDI